MGMQLQSILFEESSLQVSYYEDEGRNEAGLKIITNVMNPMIVPDEVAELIDATEQLIAAWEAMHRERAVPIPSPRT